MGTIMRATMIAGVMAASLMSGPAMAKDRDFDWTMYPEMAKDQALPKIAASLRNTLFDAGSVTNFMMCYPPVKVKVKDGRPVRWTVMLSLNSKNRYGGYAGNQAMAAVFYSDRPVWTFSVGMPIEALGGRALAGCERVPDAQIQRLIQSE